MANRKTGKRPAYKFDAEKKRLLVELYASGNHTISSAAKALNITRATVFNARRNDPEFAEALEKARESMLDAVEDMIHELGRAGNLTALFGVLRAWRPQRWRENVAVSHSGSIDFAGSFAQAMERVASGSQPGTTQH